MIVKVIDMINIAKTRVFNFSPFQELIARLKDILICLFTAAWIVHHALRCDQGINGYKNFEGTLSKIPGHTGIKNNRIFPAFA